MGRSDDKFAWPKSHAVNGRLDAWLQQGHPVEYDDLVAATDRDGTGDAGMVSFRTGSAGAEKGSYVIFEYGLVLADARGRCAVFTRVHDDKGHGARNLAGRSILVNGSRMMTPSEALESILEDKLSFGRGESAGEIEPLGFALNRQPRRDGLERGHYLFALYRVRLSTNRLNGLVRENPDSFHGWCDPRGLAPEQMDGPVDRVLLEDLLHPSAPRARLTGQVLYQPASRFVDGRGRPLAVDPFDVNASRTVFISHDAAAQLKAFLLRDVLIKRSRQRLFPFLDVHEVLPDGRPFWQRIESLIERSDVFLVLVTEGTAASAGVRRELDYALALPDPPEIVAVQVDGTEADRPPGILDRNLFDYRGRAYRLWHSELSGLIENLRERPFRAGTLGAKDPE